MGNERKNISSYILIGIVTIFIIVFIAWLFIGGYIMKSVGETELGVKLIRNKVVEILPPGVYTDIGFFRKLVTINIEHINWCAVDPEVLTSDSQRIGLAVCGTVQRPTNAETIISGWASFKVYYTNDLGLAGEYHFEATDDPTEQRLIIDESGLLQILAQQAMKVCVGDRPFEDAVIGSARDEVRQCIDNEVSKLAEEYGGLNVANVTVPNVILSSEVQESLDAITQSKFDEALANQQAEQAIAEANKKLAEEQGSIMVSEGTKQEQARQDAITAALQAESLSAQQAVIKQQMENDLLEANLQIEINEKLAQAAAIQAEADLAEELYMATLIEENPSYAYQQWLATIMPAWSSTDKVIVPAGSDPFTILAPFGIPNYSVEIPE